MPDLDGRLTLIAGLGGPLSGLDGEARAAVVGRLEADHRLAFATLRRIVFLSYYEAPPVVAAIAGLGHAYRIAPQPAGYRLRPFSPADDAPHHRRGAFQATEEVRRVDLSGFDHLEPLA